MGFIKVGYFRIVKNDGSERYMSFDEFRLMEMETKMIMRERALNGSVRLFCACQQKNISELHITSQGVLRVAENGQQAEHMESCPKSESYAGYIAQTKKGVLPAGLSEDSLLFSISLPSFSKSVSSSSGGSGNGAGRPREKKTDLYDLVTSVNRYAWLMQTYSIRKRISEMKKEGKEPLWSYKDLEQFNRLFFGVANDIYVKVNREVAPLYELCYKKDLFTQCLDTQRQFFIYAEVIRVGEFKQSRRYQYVTVKMPSEQSSSKSVIRVETEDYISMFNGVNELTDKHIMLAGYIRKAMYQKPDGSYDVWMTLTRGIVCEVTEHGLIVENESVKCAAQLLADKRILFYRPYLAVENYGNEVPAIIIERYNQKNVLIDFPESADFAIKDTYGKGNEEYDCYIYPVNTPVKNEIERLIADLKR